MADVLLTEAGDRLVTEAGDALLLEARANADVVVRLAPRQRATSRGRAARPVFRPQRMAIVTVFSGDRP